MSGVAARAAGTVAVAGLGWLAVAQADPISGGAGWAGAGLLGLVLAVLFFKVLPDKDRQLIEVINKKDGDIDRAIEAFRAEARLMREEQARERETCQENFRSLARSIEALAQTLQQRSA